MRKIVAATIYTMIQIVLFPISLIAYVLFVVQAVLYSRKSSASPTALASLYTRYMQHKFGTRLDQPCQQLMLVLPNVPRLALRLFNFPMLLAHRLTGHVPRTYRYPYPGDPPMADQSAARTTFFDAALARHLENVDQLVILGAGWDTRAYRLPEDTRVRCFEVDAARTQKIKPQMLAKVGVNATRVTFVSADFLTEDWLEQLVKAGFQPDRPSFFLWESVTMYLDREAVESTLRKIAGTASGSVVAFDYFSAEIMQGRSLIMRYSRAALSAAGGEQLTFGIECSPPPARQHVAAFLESCGLSMEEQRNFGPETDRKAAVAGFTTAIVPVR